MFPCGSHRRFEVGLCGGDTDDGFCHGTQVADVFGRRRVGVELIEPCLRLGGGLLKLFTRTRHGHHPSEIAVELLAERIGVDHDGVVIGIEDDDLEQAPVTVGADDENSVDPGDGSQGIACGMKDVFVGDAVLPSTVGDLYL